MAMEKITKASVASRAVAEEKSKAKSRFNDLVMHTPSAGGYVAERLHFFMNPTPSTRMYLGFLHLKSARRWAF
jgi:hypothetical protein